MTFSPKAIEAAIDAYENNVDDRGNLADAMQAALTAALAMDGMALVPGSSERRRRDEYRKRLGQWKKLYEG